MASEPMTKEQLDHYREQSQYADARAYGVHMLVREVDRLSSRVEELERLLEQADAKAAKEADVEAARWQERIAETITRADLEPFDASGNESGDPLDWTNDQVRHALAEMQEKIEALKLGMRQLRKDSP